MIELAGGSGKEAEKELFGNFGSGRLTSHNRENEAEGRRAGSGGARRLTLELPILLGRGLGAGGRWRIGRCRMCGAARLCGSPVSACSI